MKTLNIAVCEDSPEEALLLRSLLLASGVSADVFVYENGELLLEAFKPGGYQLIFLDIYLDGPEAARPGRMTGMDAALKIRKVDTGVWLAFTTISGDFAVSGYEVKAERYLKKPLDPAEVTDLVRRAAAYWEGVGDEITVTVDRKRQHVSPRDILYVEAHGKRSVIHLRDETLTAYITLDEMQKLLLLPSFLRSHRSYLVNMDYIKEADRDFIMENGDKAYIGRTQQWKIRKAYRDYLVRLARGERG